MESNCCGASEWIEDTGICGNCKEHADWIAEEDVETNNWVLLEEGYPHTSGLSYEQAVEMKERYDTIYKGVINYTLFYDAYFEYTEIEREN